MKRRKVLKTAADVLKHSYGKEPEKAKESVVASPPPAAPPMAPPPEPSVSGTESDPGFPPPESSPPETKPDAGWSAPTDPAPAQEVESVEGKAVDTEAMIQSFTSRCTKSVLKQMATEAGLDDSGNKTDIARRLVEAGFDPDIGQ